MITHGERHELMMLLLLRLLLLLLLLLRSAGVYDVRAARGGNEGRRWNPFERNAAEKRQTGAARGRGAGFRLQTGAVMAGCHQLIVVTGAARNGHVGADDRR